MPGLKIRSDYFFLFFILGSSALLKSFYVFKITPYSDFLFSDMGGYYQAAWDLFKGDPHALGIYAINPPAFPLFLSFFFKLGHASKVFSFGVEPILLLNISLSTLSAAAFYFISLRIFKSRPAAFILTCVNAFSFSVFYYNAFVLTENFSNPLVLIAIFFLFLGDNRVWALFFSGLILGAAISARPAYGLAVVPFLLSIFFRPCPVFRSIFRCAIFAIACLGMLGGIIFKIKDVSKGRLIGVSSGGGLNFMIAQCQPRSVTSAAGDYVKLPSTVDKPEYGDWTTGRPFFDQEYFYSLGLGCIRQRGPAFFWKNLTAFKSFFIGPLFPRSDRPAWGLKLLQIVRGFDALMILSVPLLFFSLQTLFFDRLKLIFILGLIFWNLTTLFLFSDAEQRYFYSFEPFLLILSGSVLLGFLKFSRPVSKEKSPLFSVP